MKKNFLFAWLIVCFIHFHADARGFLAGAKKDGKWGFINDKGEWIIQPAFDKVLPFREGLAAANIGFFFDPLDAGNCRTGKWGFIDKTGKWVVEPRFDAVESFQEGFARVNAGASYRAYQGITLMGGKWGFIKKDGSWLIQPNDTLYTVFSEGYCAFKIPKGSKWGYIDNQNQVSIAPDYWTAGEFRQGVAPVMKGSSNHQYIDRQNGQAFPRSFRKAWPFSGDRAFVLDESGRAAFINTEGKVIFTIDHLQQNDNISLSFSEGLVRVPVEKDETVNYGYMDKSGKWIIEPVYQLASHFQGGFSLVFIDLFYWFIDVSGRKIFRLPDEVVEDSKTKVIFKGIPHPNIGHFSNGLCRVKLLDQWGFVDKTGKMAIKASFEDLLDFSNSE